MEIKTQQQAFLYLSGKLKNKRYDKKTKTREDVAFRMRFRF